jgi:hypothetical protein
MGVDGIGGGGRPIPPVGGGAIGEAGGVEPTAASGVEGSRGPAQTEGTLLDRLKRGEIDIERYLDAQVDAAVAHVEGPLGQAQLDFIKGVLREQLASDPVLVELLRRATGSLPTPRAG